jgi:hypothetical protein
VNIDQRLRSAARDALRGLQLNHLRCSAFGLQYADLAHMRCLTRLQLCFFLCPREDQNLTEKQIESVLQRNRGLTYLQLQFYQTENKPALRTMIKRACPLLHHLDVYG